MKHHVTRTVEPVQQRPLVPTASAAVPAVVQRMCATCEHGQDDPEVRRAAVPGTSSDGARAPAAVGELLRSGRGRPLDAGTRAYFEPRFGHSFADVRVHDNATAAETARQVRALAYTVGRDVVFGHGRYAPSTGEGRRLLAHELAHVVQQSSTPTHVESSLNVGSASAPEEREADRAADAVLSGDAAGMSRSASQQLSREPDKDAGPPDAGAPDAGPKDNDGDAGPGDGGTGDAGAAAATCPVVDKGTLSTVSWGETSGLYPTSSGGASVLYDPTKWDAAKLCNILAMRNAMDAVGSRGEKVHRASPKKGDAVEQKLAKYHYQENFQPAPEVTGDATVKWFYLSNKATEPASHPALSGSVKVASYGSFYNTGGGDVPKGDTWVHFYKLKP